MKRCCLIVVAMMMAMPALGREESYCAGIERHAGADAAGKEDGRGSGRGAEAGGAERKKLTRSTMNSMVEYVPGEVFYRSRFMRWKLSKRDGCLPRLMTCPTLLLRRMLELQKEMLDKAEAICGKDVRRTAPLDGDENDGAIPGLMWSREPISSGLHSGAIPAMQVRIQVPW